MSCGLLYDARQDGEIAIMQSDATSESYIWFDNEN